MSELVFEIKEMQQIVISIAENKYALATIYSGNAMLEIHQNKTDVKEVN